MRALLVTLLATAACYEPQARDCTVTCNNANECAGGQVCGGDGFCAAPSVAGHCSVIDAPPAEMPIALSVVIMGPGKISVEDIGVCSSDTAPHGTCTFSVPARMARQLRAIQLKEDKSFQGWTMGCSGSQDTCELTPVMAVTVGARFE